MARSLKGQLRDLRRSLEEHQLEVAHLREELKKADCDRTIAEVSPPQFRMYGTLHVTFDNSALEPYPEGPHFRNLLLRWADTELETPF